MIHIRFHSGIYTLVAEQVLPVDLDRAWGFFSTPANLGKITPPYMGFRITSGEAAKMYAGQIITYQIGILPGIRSGWVTEITHVVERCYFVDEQRSGPYAMWHHEHWFEELDGGVRMRDKVSYKLPFGFPGRLVHPLIRRQLLQIFGYRQKALERLFPA
jgi:ligand-binding SRPBCC domain-containing protein